MKHNPVSALFHIADIRCMLAWFLAIRDKMKVKQEYKGWKSVLIHAAYTPRDRDGYR